MRNKFAIVRKSQNCEFISCISDVFLWIYDYDL